MSRNGPASLSPKTCATEGLPSDPTWNFRGEMPWTVCVRRVHATADRPCKSLRCSGSPAGAKVDACAGSCMRSLSFLCVTHMRNVACYLLPTLGFPRIGQKRELKVALERYWRGESSAVYLRATAKTLRCRHWELQRSAGADGRGRSTISVSTITCSTLPGCSARCRSVINELVA